MKAPRRAHNIETSDRATSPNYAVASIAVVLSIAWITMVMALSSRNHLLMNYGVIQSYQLNNELREPLLGTITGLAFGIVAMTGWITLVTWRTRSENLRSIRNAFGWMILGLVPFLLWMLRSLGFPVWAPLFLEAVLVAAATSLSFRALLANSPSNSANAKWQVAIENNLDRWGDKIVLLACVVFGCWWIIQSLEYYDSFMLGYNDFGHFLQRVANTAAGRGFLLETPVLPAFWDHFNPGLVCLIPVWLLYPQPTLVLFLQAALLAGSALLVQKIAIAFNHTKLVATLYGVAWLAHPVVGQMNLAYTYGWHPITFAIPLLLLTVLMLLRRKHGLAVFSCLAAMSFEEGVFVIVGLTAATSVLLQTILKQRPRQTDSNEIAFQDRLPLGVWIATGLFCFVSFLLIYRFSGLAQFQTGRFFRLGNSPLEIVLSPILRPGVFWGQVFKIENVNWISGLLVPCGLVSITRGWRWLLPVTVPIAVLVIWDHQPAHSLAFHYPSTLMPLIWMAALIGSQSRSSQPSSIPFADASSALIAGLTLSLFIGQLPYSSSTLVDVEAKTYPGVDLRRFSFAEDGMWLKSQVERIRATGDECLATGRIAAHLVGVRDIETVGQYIERRQQLASLADREGKPLLHYKWILLDRQEAFQQTPAQSASIETEAISAGFQVVEDRFDVVILKQGE